MIWKRYEAQGDRRMDRKIEWVITLKKFFYIFYNYFNFERIYMKIYIEYVVFKAQYWKFKRVL